MFKVGDDVEVWSKGKSRWMFGRVEEIATEVEVCAVRNLMYGAVKVTVGGKTKWISPLDFDQIRHAVPWHAAADPDAPPASCIRVIRKRYFTDQAEIRKGVRVCGHDLEKLWFKGVEEDAAVQRKFGVRTDSHGSREAAVIAVKEWNGICTKVRESFEEMDVHWFLGEDDASGSVDLCKWLHRELMLMHPPGPNMERAITKALARRDRDFLWKLVSRWMHIDKEGNGVLARSDLAEALSELRKASTQAADILAVGMLHNLDSMDLGQASYSEFVANCLKIDFSEVALYWYDLSNDWAKYLSPLLLGSSETGIWHTGIVVFGREYFFGGKTTWQSPGATVFGRPAKLQRLGLTPKSLDVLREHMFMELDRKFDRRSYDVLEHNCNHFADEVSYFLLGCGIPDEVKLQPKRLMNAPVAKMLRPLLNHWLGRVEGDQHEREKKEKRSGGRTISLGGA